MIDLDEMEVSLGYLDDWKQLIREVRALRKVEKAALFLHGSVDYPKLPNHKHHDDLTRAFTKLEKVRRG